MTNILSFEETMERISSFAMGSEKAHNTFKRMCDFIMRNIDAALKTTIFDAIQSNITDRASKVIKCIDNLPHRKSYENIDALFLQKWN